MLACYRVLTKNTKICTYSVHFSFRNVCPACILAPFLIPDSFVATPHSISCLYTKKKKLNLFFLLFLIGTKPSKSSNPFTKKRIIPIVEYPFAGSRQPRPNGAPPPPYPQGDEVVGYPTVSVGSETLPYLIKSHNPKR